MKFNTALLRLAPFSQSSEMASKASLENDSQHMRKRRVIAVVTRVVARKKVSNISSGAGLHASRSSRNTFLKKHKNVTTKYGLDRFPIKIPIRTNVLIDVFLEIFNLILFLLKSRSKEYTLKNSATTATTDSIVHHCKRVCPHKFPCYDSATTVTTGVLIPLYKLIQVKGTSCYDSMVKEVSSWQS